jgi:hypothetical protein
MTIWTNYSQIGNSMSATLYSALLYKPHNKNSPALRGQGIS